jgi:RND family efflux transporter MFP subunit
VVRANLASDLTLTGEFAPYQEVDVMAKVAGYVKTIRVDIGDHVREGQSLATLEIPEMENELTKAAAAVQQASAELQSASDALSGAESAHDLAHLSYNRVQDVAKREAGLVPQQEVDEFRSRDLMAEAQVAAAKSNLRAAQQKVQGAEAEKARLQTLFKYAEITAPFTGVVTKRYANIGSMIQAGTASQSQAMPVIRLSQNNLLRLTLPVPESAVPGVHIGQSVGVDVPSLKRTFPGRVARFADRVQQSTRTMDTEVDVPNESLTLVPGMFAEVKLRVEQRDNALAVPLDAVEGSGAAATVYVVTQAGTIRIKPVNVGMETAQRFEIRSGVAEGDLVVVGRHAGLKEGDRVQPKMTDDLGQAR